MSTCDRCGAEVKVGDWPWCPHGEVRRFGEEPLEPYFDEHIRQGGAHITTRGERRRLMEKNNLFYKKRKTPPGERIFVDLGRR